jgi:hypothetical protein
LKKENAAVKGKRGKKQNGEEKKRQAGTDIKKITPGKAAVNKTVGRGKEKRAKTCQKGIKFNYLSSDEEENTFCLLCCEKYATNEEWVQCPKCAYVGALGVCRKRSPICVCINCENGVPEKRG